MSTRTAFYKSKAWNQVKNTIWLKQNLLCANCNRPVYVDGLSNWIPKENRIKGIVHHKIHITPENVNDPNITLNFDNLKYVCRKCHAEEHGARSGLRYVVNDAGRVICREK